MQNVIWLDLGGVNAYLLEQKGEYLLVDTGGHMFMDKTYNDRCTLLEEKLREVGVNETNLKAVLLTHGDIDHVGNAACIRRIFGASIWMSEKDLVMVENPEWTIYQANSRYESGLLSIVFRLMKGKIERLMQKVYSEFERFTPDGYLKEGDNLEQFGFAGNVYEVPGHTVGSICILTEEGDLLAGDLFANNRKPSLAVNAIDFDEMRASAKRMQLMKVRKIYPGHGKPYSI